MYVTLVTEAFDSAQQLDEIVVIYVEIYAYIDLLLIEHLQLPDNKNSYTRRSFLL